MRWYSILLTVVWLGFGAVAPAEAQTTTRISLIKSADTVKPGDSVTIGVQFRMKSMWHVYWHNPGLGLPVEVRWTLPPGVTAGATQWPVPEKLEAQGLISYVYNDEVVLLAPMQVASNPATGPVTLKAHVTWLECAIDGQCIPGQTDVETTLNLGTETKASADAAIFETWRKRLPSVKPDIGAKATWAGSAAGDSRMVILEWTPKGPAPKADFYPFKDEKFDVEGKTEKLAGDGGKIRLKKEIKKSEGNWPGKIAGLLVEQTGDAPVAHEVELSIGSSAGGGGGQSAGIGQFLIQLGAALLGGLILNVMPCVLPVIALKVLGFVNQSKEEPARVRKLGLVYGAGVLASFVALAIVTIAVQKAGGLASWSTAFQNPQFRVVLTVVMTLVALNLFGVFEVVLGGRTMGAASDLASRSGYGGAFFNGVLATLLATPCTAPFLAGAVGFAFTQPPLSIVLIFLGVGVGLAAPFVLLCWQPRWMNFLPKPGRWMERFKIAMGFPMLATAVWLFWVTAPRLGGSGVLWLGMFLVMLAMAAWVWGEFVQRGSKRRGLAIAASLLLIGTAYGAILEKQLHWRSPNAVNADAIVWQPWSPEAVAKARREGHPVLVDFTADTCWTCQVNKTTSIDIRRTREKLREINAVTLIADFTDLDAAIAKELKRFNSPGVPLVLVYSADENLEPQVLPTLLTPAIVLEALDKAAKQSKPSVALK